MLQPMSRNASPSPSEQPHTARLDDAVERLVRLLAVHVARDSIPGPHLTEDAALHEQKPQIR